MSKFYRMQIFWEELQIRLVFIFFKTKTCNSKLKVFILKQMKKSTFLQFPQFPWIATSVASLLPRNDECVGLCVVDAPAFISSQ
jgi:hypothetical protein